MPPTALGRLPRDLVLAAAAALALASCSHDPAEREYMAALRGEETGMGRKEQLARLDRAIALQPRRAWYRETHAIYSIDERQYDRAAADIDTAIQLADRPYLHFLRGMVACERGDYNAALPDFDHAIEEQPKNIQFYRGRSLARSRVGRFDEALQDADQMVALAPMQAEGHYARGVALAGLGRWPEAVQAYDESIRLRPDLIYARRDRAAAFAQLGDSIRAGADTKEIERRQSEESIAAMSEDPFRY